MGSPRYLTFSMFAHKNSCQSTKDGVPVVWHDESITAEKCQDTAPAVSEQS